MSDKTSFRGQPLASYGRVSIFDGFPYRYYEVSPPSFSQDEQVVYDSLVRLISGRWSFDELMAKQSYFFTRRFAEEFREKIITPVTYKDLLERIPSKEDVDGLCQALSKIIVEFVPMARSPGDLALQIIGDSVGYGKLSPLMADNSLEEVMVNGFDQNVFVYHNEFGPCKTNMDFSKRKDLEAFLQKISKTVGKEFDEAHPLLDARLPDGSRANATFISVTPLGPSLTIRKFSAVPLSIIDLIENGTISSEVAAFLWVMIDGFGIDPNNLIVTGGSGSGKTTTLNALAAFMRNSERVLTIEDTLELHFGQRENWVQMESRPKMKSQDEVTMDDLLKNALRMRPDRIILGEVRGSEAETLFIAMDTGHNGCMGTMHSNSAKEMLLRLKSEPMSVPESLVPLLDLAVVQYRIYIKGKGVLRRISSVTEITSMDNKALLSNVYDWDRAAGKIKRTDVPCSKVEELSGKTGRTKKEVEQEMSIRKSILEWMLRNGIKSYLDVSPIIQGYYHSPEIVLEKLVSEQRENK